MQAAAVLAVGATAVALAAGLGTYLYIRFTQHRLQRQAGRVVPDSFTHGTSVQRLRWFRRGFESGELARCDTFAAREI